MRVLRMRHPLTGLVALLAIGAVVFVVLSARPADAAPAAPGGASGTVVQTADGPVCGIVSGSTDEWLGIPYAAPPVGALR